MELETLLAAANDAVVATLRPDGAPAAVPCWYRYESGSVCLSILSDARRLNHLRRDPRLALSVILSKQPYRHISLRGRVCELRDDPSLADIDALAQIYEGRPYADRSQSFVTAVMRIDHWFAYGLALDVR